MIFVDLEKAYDKVPREVLWRTLKRNGVNIDYIQVIKDMYARVVTVVKPISFYFSYRCFY